MPETAYIYDQIGIKFELTANELHVKSVYTDIK